MMLTFSYGDKSVVKPREMEVYYSTKHARNVHVLTPIELSSNVHPILDSVPLTDRACRHI